jgi:hypothetical protein
MMRDPLMFAVPDGVDPSTDNGWAILGPCWGPDFDEIVFTAIGRKIIPDQRKLLSKTVMKIWG